MAAAHGWWCNSRTYPMKCKFCGDRVFSFSCDCGSKKILSSLGGMWPEDYCRKHEEGWLKLEHGTEIRPMEDFYNNIESEYVQAVEKAQKSAERSTRQPKQIQRQQPYHNCQTTERVVIR